MSDDQFRLRLDSDLSQSVMDNVILGPRETGRLTNDHYFDVSLNSQNNIKQISDLQAKNYKYQLLLSDVQSRI